MNARQRERRRRRLRRADLSVLDYALSVGIDAFERADDSTWVLTPWHAHPVRLLDHTDVEFLEDELHFRATQERAA